MLHLSDSIFHDQTACIYIYIFFPSLISFLAALPLFTWCLSPSFSLLKRRNNRQTKSFPVQQCWQYDAAHYRYLISAAYKGHRNIFFILCSLSEPCCFHMWSRFFKTGDLCFPKERNTLPKESKCCRLTFSAFGFSAHLTWPDRSGEERN